MELNRAVKIIYFNDRQIGETNFDCTQTRKSELQKKYSFYNPLNGAKSAFFCEDFIIYPDTGIVTFIGEKKEDEYAVFGEE